MFKALLTLLMVLAIGQPDCSFDSKITGKNCIYVWQDKFVGTACRTWQGDAKSLRVELNQESGGYDVGVAYSESPQRVRKVFNAKPMNRSLTVDLKGDGTWWAGPKTCICQTPDWRGLPGNWECYIIEVAEKDPAALVEFFDLKDTGNAMTYRGKTVVDGGEYHHYTRPWETWTQVISIRQQYQSDGPVNYGPIVRYWHETIGVPDWYFHSPKVSIETAGANQGVIEWTNIRTPSIR